MCLIKISEDIKTSAKSVGKLLKFLRRVFLLKLSNNNKYSYHFSQSGDFNYVKYKHQSSKK